MEIRVLGPVEVTAGGRPVSIGAGKPRALLVMLAVNEGSTVSTDRLVEGLWGEEPPASAAKMVQLGVSQLRKALAGAGGGAEIVTRGRGYELRLANGGLDARRFEQLVEGGMPREGLALWRGGPLAEVADEPFAVAEVRRLEELRLTALELAIEQDLAAGRHREVVGELDALVAAEPLRERLHAQRLLALYRSGRQADALEAYRQARHALVEAIGVEPGPELRRLHEAILRQDPELEPPGAEVTELPPERIHRAAGEWARAEAAGRLDAAAGRAASKRAGLRAAEDELAGTVVELEAARERARPPPDPTDVVVCPFKGLASFDVEDAAFFFGRERLVAEMVARLAGAPLMGIVGPSGSGKSSALRAGLLPALAEGVLPGSESWALVQLRPGEHPMRALEDATAEAAPGGRLVLAVDQFEEVFTACRDESEREAFVDALVASVRDPRRRALVLVAVRADFYGRCAAYPELWRLLGSSQVPVGPMRRDELRRAIELPARRAGLEVEPDLTDALIADVEGEPGALPLLSTSLLELWQHRDGRRLGLAAYEQAGGVHGAVARLAESAYERLDASQQRVARAILLRLAGEGGGDAAVGARVGLEEFGESARPVLAELTDSRLLTVSAGEVEVAHEALLREWPRLRGWLEDDAEGRRLHRNLRRTAKEWEAGGRDSGDLYRGARLASALDWATEHDPELNDVERAFLDDSRAASGRAHRRLRMVLAGVAALLLLAVIAGAVALDQRSSARREAVAADAQRLGAQALVEDDLDRSLLLARQGVALDDSLQTRGNLLAALLKSPAAIGVVRGDGDRLISLDLSPDERTLAFIDHDGTLSFVDTRTRRPAGRPTTVPGLAGVIVDAFIRPEVRFSPDGSRLAVGGGKPIVLDARTHRVLAALRSGDRKWCIEPGGACWILYALRFSPDGRTLVAALTGPPDWSKVIVRFDPSTGRQLGRAREVARGPDDLPVLMLTRDGRRLVTTFEQGATVISDARTLRPLQRFPVGAQTAALSPDGRTMLAGASDGSVRFVDLVNGDVTTAFGRHDGAVVQAAFSPNGAVATTAGADGRTIVWDVDQAAARETLEGHAGQITGLTISRDNSTLYTSALDGKVIVWDLAGARRLGRPFDVGPDNPSGDPRYALSPDGRVLAAGHGDGTVSLVDARTLRTLSTFPVLPKTGIRAARGGLQVRGMGYIPRGRLLVVGGDDGFLALVDPRRGTIVKRLPGHRATDPVDRGENSRVFTPSFSADGRLMATASRNGIVRLWALPSGRPVGRPLRYSPMSRSSSRSNAVGDVSLSPNGRLLAVTRPPTGGVQILDVATMQRRATLSESKTVWDLARFTPDGRYIVAGSYKGWVRLWSTKTWRPVSGVFTGPAGRVEWEATSPDGRTLATGGPDGAVRLWDLRTQHPLGAPLPGVPNRAVAPQFTPDGAYLFAVTNAGRAFRWDVRPSTWASHACEVAGRPLTRTEWNDALPGRDYNPAC
jgi:WD40 repeat protein/DNA-binding SARP family transcriptional activator